MLYDDIYCNVQKRPCSTVFVEVRITQHNYIVDMLTHEELVSRRSWLLQVILLMSINWNNCILYIGILAKMPSFESDSSTIALRGPPEKLGLALTQVYKKVHVQQQNCNLFYI